MSVQTVTVARHAMATRFEILLHGENPTALRAAGEQALDEVERLEDQLSLYRPTSEISHVNRYAAERPVRVTPPVFALLAQARRLWEETHGTFDVTVGPLVRCWGFMGGTGQLPDPQALAAARACVGMQWVGLDPLDCTVRFARPGLLLDLGAIGKGYAIDQAALVLQEAGVTSALLHGGTSSSFAIGAPPDSPGWRAAIPRPAAHAANALGPSGAATGQDAILATAPLREESLSVSAVWGRSFHADGHTYGHVIDPRTAEPVQRAVLAAIVLPSATEADALSTALLTLGEEGLDLLARTRPGLRALLVVPETGAGRFRTLARGDWLPGAGEARGEA